MKKVVFLILTMTFGFFLNAQDFYSPTSDLTNSELTQIEGFKSDIEKAEKMTVKADGDYQKYKKLLTSRKKSKKKKGEKKMLGAKKSLLQAQKQFGKGYEGLYELYAEKLTTVNFLFPEDQTRANVLKTEAEEALQVGKQMFEKYNRRYSDKDLKKVIKFKTIDNTTRGAAAKEKEAVQKLVEALDLYEKQDKKKESLDLKEDEAWSSAVMENSINGYSRYLNEFPNGKYVAQAQQKITELENKIRAAEELQNNPSLVYHIQIMADNFQWNQQDILSKIYYTNEVISETYIDGWYKYWIGNFSSYKEAKKEVKKVRRKRRGAFIIGTINGEPVDIMNALSIEENR